MRFVGSDRRRIVEPARHSETASPFPCNRPRDRLRGSVVARAQQTDRMRRIGVLTGTDENDPVSKTLLFAFTILLRADEVIE